VDIDPQAVEVTKLSLLLKVLEGENQQTIDRQLRIYHERALPDLSDNIKCGNSLIGPDFYEGKQINLFDEEEKYRVNAFDWQKEFPEILTRANPGFDAVIGNPPYFSIDDTWGKGDARQKYIKRVYSPIHNDKTDVLFYFLAKAVEVAKGEIGFIVSRAFLEAYKANKLRRWLSRHSNIREIMDFRNYHVFRGVGITTAIVTMSIAERPNIANNYKLYSRDFNPQDLSIQKEDRTLFQKVAVAQEVFGEDPWVFAGTQTERVIQKIDGQGEHLGNILIIGQGMQTGRNKVFGTLNRDQISEWGLKKEQCFMRVRNSDVFRYYIRNSGEFLLYLEDTKRFTDLPERVQGYLKLHQTELKARAAYKRGDCEWWRYTWPLHKECIDRPKIYCPYLATYNRFAFDGELRYLGLTDTIVLFDNNQPENLHYIMALLNSRLLTFRFQLIGKLKGGGILEFFWNTVSKLPIRRINFSDPTDKSRHDEMVKLVDLMLDLRKRISAAKTEHEKTVLQRQIDATDKQIDSLVYELYNLTEEEIKIVEGMAPG
jgi:hypothetical protein